MLNKVILMGRLTKDPELRNTPNGVSVASFTLAVDRDYARQGEERKTDFINIVAWRNTADFVSKYFTKGQLVAVCGKLQVRSWDDTRPVRGAMPLMLLPMKFSLPKARRTEYRRHLHRLLLLNPGRARWWDLLRQMKIYRFR